MFLPLALLGHEYGPNPRYTAAPGDDPMACATSGCHTGLPKGGPINPSGGGGVTATFSGGLTYTPGGPPITITVTVTDPTNTHYGFQMTARLESDLSNGQAGDFTAGVNQLVICDDTSVKGAAGCPANSPVQFIEHAYPAGTHVGSTPYTFTWTPPATNVGNVHFYIAGNSVNNNLQADPGDHVYTNSYVMTPAAACTLSGAPNITSINSATDFGGWSNFASGSYLEIKGSNLAPDSRTWAGADFSGNNAPTQLDGVTVSINGKSAYVYYISPAQIDVQAPDDSTTGSVPITVTTCAGASNSMIAPKTAIAAGMQAPASFLVNGTQYMVALIADTTLPLGYAFVGNTNLSSSPYFYRPAKPGDSLIAYGLGFGPVKTTDGSANPPGVITTVSNSISSPVTISFGSTQAKVGYFGLAPEYVGLYQFNITVPPGLANGDYPINVTVGGTALAQKMSLTVHN